MQVTIHFHGEMKRFCPDGFTCFARSALDAVNLFFGQNRKAARNKDGSRRVVQVARHNTEDALTRDLNTDRLDICPAFCGAGAVGRMIAGAVLIAVSFALPGPWNMISLSMGISLLAGGVVELLSPAPKLNTPQTRAEEKTPDESRYLGAAGNTTAVGTRIPIGYGRYKVFGHIVSFDVQADLQGAGDVPPPAMERYVGNGLVGG